MLMLLLDELVQKTPLVGIAPPPPPPPVLSLLPIDLPTCITGDRWCWLRAWCAMLYQEQGYMVFGDHDSEAPGTAIKVDAWLNPT